MNTSSHNWDDAARVIAAHGLAVLPTDTLYGVVGLATSPAVVDRIYQLRQRQPHKPLISLIGDVSDLERFGIELSERSRVVVERVWPGPVTIVLPTVDPALHYLHRGSGGVSFRLPAKRELRDLIRRVGPVVAPSANPESSAPAATIDEARSYFGAAVEAYVDEGPRTGAASALVSLVGGELKILRPAPGFDLRSIS